VSGPEPGGEPRIGPLSAEAAHAATPEAHVADALADLSIFRVLLRHPQLARALERPLAQLLFRNQLDARLRELAIMRIAWNTACCYEWTQHWRVARDLGVAASDLLGVRDPPGHSGFGSAERAVLAAVDETVRDGSISDRTWTACSAALGGDEQALLELVTAIGWWRMLASILETLRVPLEDGVERWPPDGRSP